MASKAKEKNLRDKERRFERELQRKGKAKAGGKVKKEKEEAGSHFLWGFILINRNGSLARGTALKNFRGARG